MTDNFESISHEDINKNETFYNLEMPFIDFMQKQTYRNVYRGTPVIKRFFKYSSMPLLAIVVPVFGRHNHLKASLSCLKRQLESSHENKNMLIAVAEMSPEPEHMSYCEELGVDYIHIPSESFNKSLAMNGAVACFPSENYLFYDVDLVTEDKWLDRCIVTIGELYRAGDRNFIVQPVNERKIYYVDEEATDKVFKGEIEPRYLSSLNNLVQPEWYKGNYPPGGAVLVSANLFYAVQGYDPSLYWGYSPEDLFFLERCIKYSTAGRLYTWDEAANEQTSVYHLHHENKENSNTAYEHMVFAADLLRKNEMLSKWFSADKLRWQGIPRASFRHLHNAERRFPPSPVNELQHLYLNTTDKSTFPNLVEEFIKDKFPTLQNDNCSVYKVYLDYANYIHERGEHFFRIFKNK